MGRHARTLVLSALASLLLAVPAAAQDPVSIGTKVVEVADRDVQATCRVAGGPCQEPASEAAITAFEGSWAHDALVFQHRLADDVGMTDAPWAATHNSYNSIAEMGPALSTTDSNHQIGLVEQLRIGIRSLEIDIHRFRNENVVCHARPANEGHAGCSVEKPLAATLPPIAEWVNDHPGQVLMLYLEDHMQDAAGYDAAAATVAEVFGDKLYRPSPGEGSECETLPGTLTRDDVLAAGAQVFVVSDCGPGTGWRTVAFDWGPMHEESQPGGFEPFPGCGPYTREQYDTSLIRYYEDSTGLSHGISQMGGDGDPAKLTPATTAEMVRCGVDHIGFDQLVPSDGRLPALVWSWAEDEPSADGGTCAAQRTDARWQAVGCATARRPACRRDDGSWSVGRRPVTPSKAERECERAGAAFAAPRTGHENGELREAAGSATVLLGLRRSGDGPFTAVDTR